MNRKVINKLFALLLLVVTVLLIIGSTSIAQSPQSQFLKIPEGTASNVSGKAQDIGGMILAVVQVVGASVAIIMLIVLAIKYMSSAPNDRAEIKKHAIVYVVGAVLLFATSGLVGIIRTFAKNTFGDGSGGGAGGVNNTTAKAGYTIPGGSESVSFD